MRISKTPINDVVVIESERFVDHRGSFARFFCDNELHSVLKKRKVTQINHSSTSKKGTIRGMHFQLPPHAEMKLVRCIKGKVFDVAVDLRKNSNTFLNWYAQILSPENNKLFVIPEGCAHGFQTLENDTELLYLHTSYYEPKHEAGIRYNDPRLNIEWPISLSDISIKDKDYPDITGDYSGIEL